MCIMLNNIKWLHPYILHVFPRIWGIAGSETTGRLSTLWKSHRLILEPVVGVGDNCTLVSTKQDVVKVLPTSRCFSVLFSTLEIGSLYLHWPWKSDMLLSFQQLSLLCKWGCSKTTPCTMQISAAPTFVIFLSFLPGQTLHHIIGRSSAHLSGGLVDSPPPPAVFHSSPFCRCFRRGVRDTGLVSILDVRLLREHRVVIYIYEAQPLFICTPQSASRFLHPLLCLAKTPHVKVGWEKKGTRKMN